MVTAPKAVETGVAIVLDHVSKSFVSRRSFAALALEDITLTLPPGQTTSIIGPSGCGKTTLLMLMAGLELPSQGKITVGGKEVRGPYRGLAMVFQSDLLLPWRTALDNVLLGIELRGWRKRDYLSEAGDLLDRVGLSQFANHYPRELSGGMRQRVALARALIQKPRVILMDEPFGALDALTREQMNMDMDALAATSSASIVLVTHSIEEAVYLGDQVVVLLRAPGRVDKVIDVRLPHPRGVDAYGTSVYRECAEEVRDHVMSSDRHRSVGALGLLAQK